MRDSCPSITPPPRKNDVRGFVLLESMVAAILLVVGIFGVLKMIANSTVTVSDSEYRALAIASSMEMMEEIRLRVNRENKSTIRSSLVNEFQHQPEGDDCQFTGAVATKFDVVGKWERRLIDGVSPSGGAEVTATRLPGVTEEKLQIKVDDDDSNGNRVSITICWQAPNDKAVRRQQLTAYIN